MLIVYIGLVVLLLFLFTIATFKIRMDYVNKHEAILGTSIVYIIAFSVIMTFIKVLEC